LATKRLLVVGTPRNLASVSLAPGKCSVPVLASKSTIAPSGGFVPSVGLCRTTRFSSPILAPAPSDDLQHLILDRGRTQELGEQCDAILRLPIPFDLLALVPAISRQAALVTVGAKLAGTARPWPRLRPKKDCGRSTNPLLRLFLLLRRPGWLARFVFWDRHLHVLWDCGGGRRRLHHLTRRGYQGRRLGQR
jgi:hypothetical protein